MIYAAFNRGGQEIAWGASPSLAMQSAALTHGRRIADLERSGHYPAPSSIRATRGGLLEQRARVALRDRTPEQRRFDALYSLRYRTGPMIVAGVVAIAAAAWAALTGIR